TYTWKPLGLRDKPSTRDGIELHAQFWRRMVLWAAHQDQDESAAFARPEFRRLPVRGKQTVRVGLRGPGGADVKDPSYEVKIVAPGQKPEDAATRPVVQDGTGTPQVPFEPGLPGEYTVVLKASGTDGAGKTVQGTATARFLAYPETSDEMLRVATDNDFLQKLATNSGGRSYKLDDLPRFLKELRETPLEAARPKPRYLPDWRRQHSQGFLPGWLLLFVVLLGVEWGCRRLWGLV
ncbi:MAG: hypothetical protein ACRCZF_13805, partial [Gemmataceae bacterium]